MSECKPGSCLVCKREDSYERMDLIRTIEHLTRELAEAKAEATLWRSHTHRSGVCLLGSAELSAARKVVADARKRCVPGTDLSRSISEYDAVVAAGGETK